MITGSTIWQDVLLTDAPPQVFAFSAGWQHLVRPSSACGIHHHAAVEIVYHPSGCGRTLLAGHPLEFVENSIVVYAPGEPHDQAMFTDGEDLCVQLSVPEPLCAELKTGFYLGYLQVPWIIEELRQLSARALPTGGIERKVLDLRATAILLGLVGVHAKGPCPPIADRGEEHVRKAERFVQEHFATILSLDDVATHVGISRDYLRHLFKSSRGGSLLRYLNEVRLAHAKFLLTRSALPLKQIAARCGFCDAYYFSRVFRQHTAMSPGRYRQNAMGQ